MSSTSRLTLAWLLLTTIAAAPFARGAALVTRGESWRYFRGVSNPSPSKADAWRLAGFNDSTWKSGAGAFHYGAALAGTELADMQNGYTTVFLRKKFLVTNASSIARLELNALCDDGFVAWINGTRVAEFNAPAGEPAFSDVATATVVDATEYTNYELPDPTPYLLTGENILTVVVLNSSISSGDAVFDAELVATERSSPAPVIAGVIPVPGLVSNLTSVTVTFSEPVTGVETNHFLVNGAGVPFVTGSGAEYTFTFPQPEFGTVQITWGTLNQIHDFDDPPQKFSVSAPGSAWNYELLDPAGPTMTVRRPAPGLILRSLGQVEVTFTRPVSGVDAEDLRLNGQPALQVTGVGAGPYLFEFASAASGPVTVTWSPDHGIESQEPVPHPFAATGWSYTVDPNTPAPEVVINELLAENLTGTKDEDGDPEDWIELQNRGNSAVNLEGWSLSNSADDPGMWTFPPVFVPAGGYLVVWTSAKDRRTPPFGKKFHTNFKLNPSGDTVRLFGPELPRQVVSEIEYPEQGPDYSYGRQPDGENEVWRYFEVETPGAANGLSTITGKVDEVHFSVERGFYDNPVNLSLATLTPDATIRFTTNGTLPTATGGFVYSVPIVISASKVIRAAAFAPNHLPSRSRTHTYLYGIQANRRLLPAMSLVTATNNLYGRTGIMESNPRNTDKHGPAWERPVSVEYIRPEDNGGFQVDAGLRVQGGGYIRGLYDYRRTSPPEGKYSFRVYFRGEYGEGRLNYPLFPRTTLQSFDTIVLRAGMNDPVNPFIRDEICREMAADLGLVSSHGTFVNLFLNGVYKGYYNPTERIDIDFLQDYHGGGRGWDLIGSFGELREGDLSAWNSLQNIAQTKPSTNAANYLEMVKRLDVTNFVDYLLVPIYVDSDDWPHNNYRAARERKTDGRFRFYVWDAEWSWGFSHDYTWNTINGQIANTSPPWGGTEVQRIFNNLKRNYEFRLLFADRVHRAYFNNGALIDVNIRKVYEDVKARINGSIPSLQTSVFTSWLANRRKNILKHLQSAGFLASSNAPALNQFGGRVPAGFELVITNLTGAIYYTTNGVDPRVAFTGGVASDALPYTAALTLNESLDLKVRSLSGTNWSALTQTSFQVARVGTPLKITEIMYNPPGGDAYEFVELLNTGPTPLDLSGFALEGVGFRFPSPFPVLPAGERLVLASDADPTAFAVRYPGLKVAAYYDGALSNSGERLALLDRAGKVVVSVSFGDHIPWVSSADGGGASLELADLNADPDDPANWHASTAPGGSPGAANSIIGLPAVRLSEASADRSSGADWLELYNSSESSVGLAGWSLTDDSEPRKFVFPADTSIPGGGYLVLTCDTNTAAAGLHTGFALDRDGETLTLLDPETNRVDVVTFGSQVVNLTFGRIEPAAAWHLCKATPGGPNEAAALAAPEGLRINEFLADSESGDDWIELYNPGAAPASLQGLHLSTSNALFRVTAPAFVAANGFVVLHADENPGPNHADFKLPSEGGTIALSDGVGIELDRITYKAQQPLVSTGRFPDGTGEWTNFPFSSSPGTANYRVTGSAVRLTEFMARNDSAVANSLGWVCDWVEIHNTTTGSLALEGYALSVGKPDPEQWKIPAGVTLGPEERLVLWCNPDRPTSTVAGPVLNTGRGLPAEGGTLTVFDAAGRVLDFLVYGAQLRDAAAGRDGENWRLLTTPTPGQPNATAATLGSSALVRFNEWLAESGTTSPDWFELYNPGALPTDLGGHFLTDDPSISGLTRFTVPMLTLIAPGGHVRFVADGDPGQGPDHVSFQLDALGENLRLSDPSRAAIDSLDLLVQTPGVSEGRFPDGAVLILPFPGSPSPGAANWLPDTDRDHDGMSDPYEIVNGFNPDDPTDGPADPDGDGMTNAEESRAGTDPRDAESVFRLEIVGGRNSVTVRFTAIAGHTYSVLQRDTVEDSSWTSLTVVPAGATRVVNVTDLLPPAALAMRLYRVVSPALP